MGDLYAGSVGLTSKVARENGIKPITSKVDGLTKARYFPNSEKITVKLITYQSKRIIGAQIISKEGVKGRIDAISAGIRNGMNTCEMSLVETCYVPPASPLVDVLTEVA
ncbi:MAG: hypothetical protein SVM80_01325 [Halobacteriota archaeon]|nr:hypothetical protein [Halobacteriota archaeon]